MLIMIGCSACGHSGGFDVEIKFVHKVVTCTCCYNHQESDWKYYFCNIKCLTSWLTKYEVVTKGFPCLDCHITGFAYGIEDNGPCGVCNGTRAVKDSKDEKTEPKRRNNE